MESPSKEGEVKIAEVGECKYILRLVT